MLYVKYAALFVLYSTIVSFIFIVADVVMYPALLQGLINKRLPFSVIVKDLYKDFIENEKTDTFHKVGASFLNSIASFGYQVGMLVYMLVLIVLYSLLGLFMFNVVSYGLAAFGALINFVGLVSFFDFFNIIFEIYGFIIVAFLLSTYVSFKYHRYINERFELKKKGIGDYLHTVLRIIVFTLPGILVYFSSFSDNAVSRFIYFIGKAVNVVTIPALFADNIPSNLLQFTDGDLFILCSGVSIVLLLLFDVSYAKRLSNKTNKKILKETKRIAKEQDELVKVQAQDLSTTKEELETIKKDIETAKEKENVVVEEAPKVRATFIDLEEDEVVEDKVEEEKVSE